MKIVRIDWIDSCAGSGWQNAKTARAEDIDLIQHSVGFLLNADSSTVTISSCIQGSRNNARSAITIPRVAIQKMRTIGKLPATKVKAK